jgi:uroporphyrin-III C-methyltransferase/precorrin-2 dehydrogenase/sirohydrochlorin ferrochelatase
VAVLGGGDPRLAVAVRDAVRDGLADGTLHRPPTRAAAPADGAPAGAAPAAVQAGGGPAGAPAAGPAGGGGSVALVGAGPGEPELITVRGRRLLAEADVVVADRLAIGLLLDELRPEAELIDASKIPYGPAAAQAEINRILVERARAGAAVVRLKGGDPYVFGRGGEEALACVAAGVPVTVVPGVSSAVAVPAAAGIPVTHRGVAHEFVVVSGHLPPGDPGSLVSWPELARLSGTLVILMGIRHLAAIVAALLAHGRPAATPAAVIAEGTTAGQHGVRTTLAELPAAARDIRPPAVIVVGEVVAALSADTGGIQPGMPGPGGRA